MLAAILEKEEWKMWDRGLYLDSKQSGVRLGCSLQVYIYVYDYLLVEGGAKMEKTNPGAGRFRPVSAFGHVFRNRGRILSCKTFILLFIDLPVSTYLQYSSRSIVSQYILNFCLVE